MVGALGLLLGCSSSGGTPATTGGAPGGTSGGTSGSGTTGTSTGGGSSTGGTTGCADVCGTGFTCIGTQCTCFDAGFIACGGGTGGSPVCVDSVGGDSNCGACGVTCTTGEASCQGGSCVCLIDECPAGVSTDAGVCTDTNIDVNNCGGCAYSSANPSQFMCGMGEGCVNGSCQCLSGFSQCPGNGTPYCADLTGDLHNCGQCGNACQHDQECIPVGSGGECVCNTGEDGGADLITCASGCVHSDSDPLNCGGCNVPCAPGSCSGGACMCNADAGLAQCAAGCIDVRTDVKNCGACGNDCTLDGSLDLPSIVCKSGQCRCQGGQDDICFSASFPTLACVNTNQDPLNCGGCGLTDAGLLSDGGLLSSPFICSGVKTACQGGVCGCPTGQLYCSAGSWTADAGSNASDVCLIATVDPLNCGGCGNDCNQLYAPGAACTASVCVCVDAGLCVTTADSLAPACACSGSACSGVTLTFSSDIYPLISKSGTSNQTWGTLVGCATSGCHDSSAAGELAFTVKAPDGGQGLDPDAAYQQLVSGATTTQNCNGNANTQTVNPSQNCPCESLVIPDDGADSLIYQLLDDNVPCCPHPLLGACNAMPKILQGGTYHQLSPCLIAQVREWIDQGAAY